MTRSHIFDTFYTTLSFDSGGIAPVLEMTRKDETYPPTGWCVGGCLIGACVHEGMAYNNPEVYYCETPFRITDWQRNRNRFFMSLQNRTNDTPLFCPDCCPSVDRPLEFVLGTGNADAANIKP